MQQSPFEIVNEVFNKAKLSLADIALVPIDSLSAKAFLQSMFPFSNEEVQAKIAEGNVKSIYAVRLLRKWRNGIESPQFALVMRCDNCPNTCIAAMTSKAIPFSKTVDETCEMLIDVVESLLARYKKYDGLSNIRLELEEMIEETCPSQSMVVLDNGRGFYETMVSNDLVEMQKTGRNGGK